MSTAVIMSDKQNTVDDPTRRPPLVTGEHDMADVTDIISRVVEMPPPSLAWKIAITITSLLTLNLGALIGYLVWTGVGVWGNRSPTMWGWPIVNFVFWIGIGHAGTLISAVLFLFRQRWRTSINRAAEAMTLFAVVCAGMYPGIHIGRVWVAYWLFPIPNQMSIWPQFRSPLLWDMVAISTYGTVSLMFWYMGLIPDLATLRDRATTKVRYFVYGLLALGWTGSNRHWHRYERAYLLLAALATPLVLSVHSIVSFDFAVAQVVGWHSTIFPPYFVAGAIFGGFAMVLFLLIPAREFFGLKDIVTMRHIENMNKILLVTGSIVGYSYAMEFFISWYSGSLYERFAFINRALGPYSWAYATMIFCNVLSPQVFWNKSARTNLWVSWIVSILVTIGMWFERFVIIVTSLARDYLPSSWGYFKPTWVDVMMFAGTFGLFLTLFLLFCRFLPMVALSEVKGIMPHGEDADGGHPQPRPPQPIEPSTAEA